MKGTTVVKKVNTKKPYYSKAFTDADAKVTPLIEGQSFYLEPFIGWGRQDRFFYVKKVDGGYELEGELYLVDKAKVRKHIKDLMAELKEDNATVEFRLIDDDCKVLAVCKIGGEFEPVLKENPKGEKSKLEITKMLTLSTAHIKEESAKFLNEERRADLIVYPKREFGWFICLDTDCFEEELKRIPEDLATVLKFAEENGCEWLCLDCDGPIESDLPQYDW